MDLDSVRRAYKRYASVYDAVFGGAFAAGRSRALKRINRNGGLRILEVGVGTGLSLPHHRPDNRVVGIDASKEMLDIARRRVRSKDLRNVESLHEMDAGNLEFPDNSFDLAVAMFVMSVVPDPVACLREMQRVVKPGGRILMVNHFAADGGLRGRVERAMAPFARTLGWHPDFQLKPLLAAAGRSDDVVVEPVPPLGLFSLIECRVEEMVAEPRTVPSYVS